MRVTACRVCDVCLRYHCFAWAQTILRAHHAGDDERGNQADEDLDGWLINTFRVEITLVVCVDEFMLVV